MKKRTWYAIDFDLHPQYDAVWVCRFSSQRERRIFLESGKAGTRYLLLRDCMASRYAIRHNAFYDTGKMLPMRIAEERY